MTLRCRATDDGYVVSCEVYPVDRFVAEPVNAGPYVFATQHEANEFAVEAGIVLEYLGCELVDAPR